jgi:hypothetical protein
LSIWTESEITYILVILEVIDRTEFGCMSTGIIWDSEDFDGAIVITGEEIPTARADYHSFGT